MIGSNWGDFRSFSVVGVGGRYSACQMKGTCLKPIPPSSQILTRGSHAALSPEMKDL